MKRALVLIRVDVLSTDSEEDWVYGSEWAHVDDVERDSLGVTLRWPYRGADEVFVPWASVIRIDTEDCSCANCKPAVRTAA